MTRFLTSHEVATLVQVSPSAVLKWIDTGKLKAFRTPGGHRRVGSPELIDFLKVHEMPVPGELEGDAVRLLVIDDEANYLRALGPMLRRADSRVEVALAESAVDGLLKVGVWRPQVVLLDSYMPGMDGVEVCQRLKASGETTHIAVLAMSGRPSAELERRFVDAGAVGFLPKPVDPSVVMGKLYALGLVRTRT